MVTRNTNTDSGINIYRIVLENLKIGLEEYWNFRLKVSESFETYLVIFFFLL